MSLKVLMHTIAQLAKEPHEQDFVSVLDANDVDGRCETAGCDALTSWLQADHDTPYSETGQSTLADLRSLCRPDNLAKGDGPPLAPRPESEPPSVESRQLWGR